LQLPTILHPTARDSIDHHADTLASYLPMNEVILPPVSVYSSTSDASDHGAQGSLRSASQVYSSCTVMHKTCTLCPLTFSIYFCGTYRPVLPSHPCASSSAPSPFSPFETLWPPVPPPCPTPLALSAARTGVCANHLSIVAQMLGVSTGQTYKPSQQLHPKQLSTNNRSSSAAAWSEYCRLWHNRYKKCYPTLISAFLRVSGMGVIRKTVCSHGKFWIVMQEKIPQSNIY